MRALTPFCALAVLASLAGCNDTAPEPAPSPTATVAAPRTLIAADLDFAKLGPRVEGPSGTDFETVLSAGPRQIGTMVSYVACPEGAERCLPAEMPEGTIYTYVHQITLAEADADAAPTPEAGDGPEVREETTTLFRTARPVQGFSAGVGYGRAEAEAALGAKDAISITLDDDHLIWRVTRGPGWQAGTAITFWWQSTTPPSGPEDAYIVEIDGNQAKARGPFPLGDKPVDAKTAR